MDLASLNEAGCSSCDFSEIMLLVKRLASPALLIAVRTLST